MANLDLDTELIRTCSNDLTLLINEYSNLVENLYSRIQNMPISTGEWVGEPSVIFANILNNVDKVEMTNLASSLYEYARFLNTLADRIDSEIIKNRI